MLINLRAEVKEADKIDFSLLLNMALSRLPFAASFNKTTTGKITKHSSQIWEFVKEHDIKHNKCTRRAPFYDLNNLV